ncbi:concanavalin A-like lectin/glucanase superfamily protein [Kribbella antiqua]|uniref:Concanavalin A-like lectin/glucanase superfamily protein n=1 Tax=Kribbella antiqua TaxID=2512217 RepID=A0A4R2J2D3_9ACTN|nr:LamG domain-containing protein [Kribbella antiqua]TCO51096.1 concanavalin A-like lectin/glucanase superfamily protein [Kribbella antiqua]
MTIHAAARHSTRFRQPWRLTGIAVVVAVTMMLVAGNAAAYWTSGSTAGAGGAAATTVNQGATPTASGVGNTLTVDWAASTLANGTAVANYLVTRYDVATQTPQLVCTVTATTCTDSAVPSGQWVYSVTPRVGINWRGLESAKSNQVASDLIAPTNAVTVAVVAGNAALSGDTIFYRGTAAGSFRLRNAVTDAGSGPASSTTTPLTGGPTWTHSASTVSTPAGGPYLSTPFTWPVATTSSPTETISGRDVAGNTSTLPLTFVDDSTAPTGGTVSYAAGYQPGKSVQISFTSGTDTGSGIAGRQLQRSAAASNAGICPAIGSYSAFVDIGPLNPASPYVDNQVTTDICYRYRYVITDLVGNQYIATNPNVAIVSYAGAVSTTTGALSLWRFGESTTELISADKFTAPTGTELSVHTTDTSWTRWGADLNTGVITAQGRLRQTAALTGAASYYTSATPSSPDYSVEADITVKSLLAIDDVGIEGRIQLGSGLTGTFYLARYHIAALGVAQWELRRNVDGGSSSLATVPQSLTAGQTYRLRLDMVGSTIRLFVNGVVIATVSDPSPISPAGRAGVRLGSTAAILGQSDTTGLQLDNFQVNLSTYPRAADSLSTNTADYKNGVTLGVTGALAGSTDTAARFDGLNDFQQAAGTTGLPVGASPRSVELWFKTTSSSQQMLFDYGTPATNQKFSLSLNAGGASMTAWAGGSGSDKTFTPASAVNDGLWHHLVKTYDGTSIGLYVDGVALAPQAAVRATVMDPYGFSIGAALNTLDPNSPAYFDGTIDEVAIYTAALNQATVTNHHQFGTP